MARVMARNLGRRRLDKESEGAGGDGGSHGREAAAHGVAVAARGGGGASPRESWGRRRRSGRFGGGGVGLGELGEAACSERTGEKKARDKVR
jgi:hypothetical protein